MKRWFSGVLVILCLVTLAAFSPAQEANVILPTVDAYYSSGGRFLLSSPSTNRGMGRWTHLNFAVSSTSVYNYDDSARVVSGGAIDSTTTGRRADYVMSFTSAPFGGSEGTTAPPTPLHHISRAYVWRGLYGVVLAIQLRNTGTTSLTGRVSLEFYPRIDQSYNGHSLRWRSQDSIVYYYRSGLPHYVAFKALNKAPVGLRFRTGTEFYATVSYAEGQPDSLRFNPSTYTSFDVSADAGSTIRSMIFLNHGSVTLNAGATTDWYYYAVAYDTTETRVIAAIKDVESKYRQTLVSVERMDQVVPSAFMLHQNYPNPFNPATTLRFDIARREQVRLSIYDALGREVAELANGTYEPGSYSVTFDVAGLPSGVYFSTLTSPSGHQTRKLLLMK